MITLTNEPVYLADGKLVKDAATVKTDPETARQGTMAYSILKAHNTAPDMKQLRIKFDKLISAFFVRKESRRK